jgi:methyl-accepting chemotaxis protein
MTIDQRLDRIEHITAGIAEERSKDRDEYKELWRDTQRQLDALATDTRLRFEQVANRLDQVANRFDQIAERFDQSAAQAKETDQKLQARIASMVSAIGEFIAQGETRKSKE